MADPFAVHFGGYQVSLKVILIKRETDDYQTSIYYSILVRCEFVGVIEFSPFPPLEHLRPVWEK